MAWQFYNAHPKGKIVGDCVKRAITVAAEMDYMEVQRQLNRYKKVTGASAFNTDYNPHKYVENVLQARKLSFPARRGCKRMTAGEFAQQHPKGRYILNMAKHWSCCVDGVIYDTWDCSEKCVYTAYQIIPPPPTVNYFTVTSKGSRLSTIRVVDVELSTERSVEMSPHLVAGYCKCLEDLGYTRYST